MIRSLIKRKKATMCGMRHATHLKCCFYLNILKLDSGIFFHVQDQYSQDQCTKDLQGVLTVFSYVV